MPKMDKNAPKIFTILLHPMVQFANLRLVEEAQNALFELAAALARNDLYQIDPPVYCLFDDSVEFHLDFVALVVDVVQIKF